LKARDSPSYFSICALFGKGTSKGEEEDIEQMNKLSPNLQDLKVLEMYTTQRPVKAVVRFE